MDPLEFLRRYAPFCDLQAAGCQLISKHLEVQYVGPGTRLLQKGGATSEFLYVVHKGRVTLENEQQVVDELEPGEAFGFPSMIGRASPAYDAIAVEESLLYRIPAAVFYELLALEAGFATFFLSELSARLRATTKATSLRADLLTSRLDQLELQPIVRALRSDSIVAVARQMRALDATSSLIFASEDPASLCGIVTDRDLRNRVLAAEVASSTAIEKIMTSGVVTLAASDTVFDALVAMLDRKFHHLPIRDNAGSIIGLVSDEGLLRQHFQTPAYLLEKIEKMPDGEVPADYADAMSAMVSRLVESGLEATRVGAVVSSLNDALVKRLCEGALSVLGPAPCDYAWLTFGSEGRKEQALLTDQDNALVYADVPAEQAQSTSEYFATFAKFVVSRLVKAGIPACKGGYMATNWCKSHAQWRETFGRWIGAPTPEAMMHAVNLFDFRVAAGDLDITQLQEIVLSTRSQSVFLAHLAKQVLSLRPEISLFGRIGGSDNRIDLKAEGIGPLVGLARLLAFESSCGARGTIDRFEAAAQSKAMHPSTLATLIESFRFLFGLRLRHQLDQLQRAQEPDNLLGLDQLSPIERRHLKDCLVAIREAQQIIERRYATSSL